MGSKLTGGVAVVGLFVGASIVELVPNAFITSPFCVLLVETDDFGDDFWILRLFLLGNAILGQHALPFFRKTLFTVVSSTWRGWDDPMRGENEFAQ